MLNYKQDIEWEARNFILNHKDMIEHALADGADFDRDMIVDLDEAFHTYITDRSYTLQDAAEVWAACEAIYTAMNENIENWNHGDNPIYEIEELAHTIFNEWETSITPQPVI